MLSHVYVAPHHSPSIERNNTTYVTPDLCGSILRKTDFFDPCHCRNPYFYYLIKNNYFYMNNVCTSDSLSLSIHNLWCWQNPTLCSCSDYFSNLHTLVWSSLSSWYIHQDTQLLKAMCTIIYHLMYLSHLYLYVCMYVCKYISMYVCTYVS